MKKKITFNAILNIFRQLCTVLFPLVTFPYVSRVLLSENYGKIAFVTSVVNYFSLLAALGINNYAIREGAGYKNERKTMETFARQIFTINVISTIVSAVLLFCTFFLWEKLNTYGLLVLILGLNIFSGTIGVEWLYSIYEDFTYITVRSILIQIISLILIFTLIKSKEDYLIYAGITVFSTFGANLFNLFHSRKYIRLGLTRAPNMKKHLKPMLLLFCNALMISIYVNSDITLLGILKNDTEVGVYSVAVKVYTIVKTLLNAFTVVLIPRLSYYVQTKQIKEFQQLSHKAIGIIMICMVPALVGLFMISKEVVLLIAGEEYYHAVTALQILCGAMGCSLIAAFFVSGVLLPYKKDKIILFSTIISSLLNLLLNFVFIPLLSGTGAAITTFVAECTVMILSVYHSKGLLKLNGYHRQVAESLLGCLEIIITCIIVNTLSLNLYLSIALKIVISCIIYGFILLLMKDDIIITVLPAIFKKKKN